MTHVEPWQAKHLLNMAANSGHSLKPQLRALNFQEYLDCLSAEEIKRTTKNSRGV